jgi:uncharacterized membrane protein (UPF0127 family)
MKLLMENWRRFLMAEQVSFSQAGVDVPDSEFEFATGVRDFEDEQPIVDAEKQKFVDSYSLSDDEMQHGAHAQAWINALSEELPPEEDPTEYYRNNILPDILSRIDQAETAPMAQTMLGKAAGYYDHEGIHMPDIETGGKPTPQGYLEGYFDRWSDWYEEDGTPGPGQTGEEGLLAYFQRHPKYWNLANFVDFVRDRNMARGGTILDHRRAAAQDRWGRVWAHEYGHHEDHQGPSHELLPRDELESAMELEAQAREIWGDEYDESPVSAPATRGTMSHVQKGKLLKLFPWLDELDPEKGASAHYERRHEIYASLMKNRQMMDDAYRRGERDTPMITAEDIEAWMMGPLEAKAAQAEWNRNWGKGKGIKARTEDAICRATSPGRGQCPSFIGSPQHRRKLGHGDVLRALWTSSPRGRTVRDDNPDRPLGWPEGKVGTGHPSRADMPALEMPSEDIADILNSIAQAEPAPSSDPSMMEPEFMVAESQNFHQKWRRFINEGEMVTLNIGDSKLKVEVVMSEEKIRRGLMFRESLEKNTGMLFIFSESAPRSFWMKNTELPLSIAYLDEHRRILNIEDMRPHDLSAVKSQGNAMYVIEANKNWFKDNNVKTGDVIEGLPL